MNCGSTNGRVNIAAPNAAVFTHHDRIPVEDCSSFRDAMTGGWYNTALSNAFFSKENIARLQLGIRAGVYEMSRQQYKIGDQSCDELKIIMRAMFLQHSRNLPAGIPAQISKLNKHVLDYAVKQVYSEAVAYVKYRRDVSTLACPVPLPQAPRRDHKHLKFNAPF